MRLTEAALRKIVREECVRVLFENDFPDNPDDMTQEQFDKWMSSISPAAPEDPELVRRAGLERDEAVSEHKALEAETHLMNFGKLDAAASEDYIGFIEGLENNILSHLKSYPDSAANFSEIGKSNPESDLKRLVNSAKASAEQARAARQDGGDSSKYDMYESQKRRWSRRR